jgi:hypothetical protein
MGSGCCPCAKVGRPWRHSQYVPVTCVPRLQQSCTNCLAAELPAQATQKSSWQKAPCTAIIVLRGIGTRLTSSASAGPNRRPEAHIATSMASATAVSLHRTVLVGLRCAGAAAVEQQRRSSARCLPMKQRRNICICRAKVLTLGAAIDSRQLCTSPETLVVNGR